MTGSPSAENREVRHFDVLAFRCDAAGIVEDVVADDLKLNRTLRPGQSLFEMIDPHSHEKARQFLATIVARQAASGWELNIEDDGRLFPAVFTGTMQGDRLFIVAGRSARDITNIVETLEMIGNEQLNAFRRAFREQLDTFDQRSRTDATAYEELSRLNNDLANAQRELSEKSRDLERLNEEKNRLLGMAAHDLRNPLSVILGYASFLGMEEEPDPEKKRMYDEIASSSRFMLDLINDLLDVSQIEAGRREIQLSTFDALAVIRRVIAAYSAPSSAKGLRLSLHAQEDGAITMTSDAAKLRQIVSNLVGNAIKFSKPDGAIDVSVMCDGPQLKVVVKDEGIGIAADKRQAIFEPFVHLAGAGTGGERSTGLGLSIVQQLVDLLGGTIRVDSVVGAGSTFQVSIPLVMSSGSR
jgi:signal transduction histidine kinase